MLYEEASSTLLCGDLFTQVGNAPTLTSDDIAPKGRHRRSQAPGRSPWRVVAVRQLSHCSLDGERRLASADPDQVLTRDLLRHCSELPPSMAGSARRCPTGWQPDRPGFWHSYTGSPPPSAKTSFPMLLGRSHGNVSLVTGDIETDG